MRPDFKSLNEEQLLALDQAEVDAYVMLELTRQGVPLEQEAGNDPRPEKPETGKTTPTYQVNSVAFLDREHAQEVTDLINSLDSRRIMEYVPGPEYMQVLGKPDEGVTVNDVMKWSRDAWDKFGSAQSAYEVSKEDWDKRDRGRRETDDEREKIHDEIQGAVNQAHRNLRQRERWATELARYVALGLDELDARKSMLLANPQAEEWLPPVPTQQSLPGVVDKPKPAPEHTITPACGPDGFHVNGPRAGGGREWFGSMTAAQAHADEWNDPDADCGRTVHEHADDIEAADQQGADDCADARDAF